MYLGSHSEEVLAVDVKTGCVICVSYIKTERKEGKQLKGVPRTPLMIKQGGAKASGGCKAEGGAKLRTPLISTGVAGTPLHPP